MQRTARTLAVLATLLIVGHAKSGEPPKDVSNSIGMKFRLIPAGKFMMGASVSDAFEEEKPRHKVRITKPFYMAVTEVTQRQYEKVTGKCPSWYSKTGEHADMVKGMDTSRFPVEMVSWNDAIDFCRKLSASSGCEYRLPTEAEWEYACRGGTTTLFHFGDDDMRLSETAWFRGNTWDVGDKYPHEVGQRKPNPFGLFDMHGNVLELCSDNYGKDFYDKSPEENPTGPNEGSYRVGRGGGWDYRAAHCRSAYRRRYRPSDHSSALGFRVALEVSTIAESEDLSGPEQMVLVLRHHPGIVDRLEDRRHDGQLIFKHLATSIDDYRYEGGLGSGYELTISLSDLPLWKAMIDRLHQQELLRYYTSIKLDNHGYGLVPLPWK